jgi:CMP-N,N'-diacetyllegionaminic acid synthase
MMNLDYVVVASSTALHREQLAFLEKNLWGKLILVEKPLFNEFYDLKIRNNRVFVGYNLRFHPLLQKIRKAISGRRLWNIQAFCGSYLPDWRPKRDYRETSSAKKDAGGGVLLDLSHELDYVRWLAGSIEVKHAVSVTVSDLDISSDDLLFVSGKTKEGAYVHITLNYFTRQPLRQILIDGKDISIRADLISNSLSVIEDGEASDNSWPDLERSDTYRSQHRAVLEDDLSSICTFAEGLETMRLIDRVRSFSNS